MSEDPEAASSIASSPVSRKSGKRLNIVIQCAFSGDTARLQECFANEDNPYHDRVEEQINSVDEESRSPVEIAATEGHLEILKFLIERGSEINIRNNESGKSPLDMACILGREDVVRELLEHGAEIDSSSSKGYTSMHHAAAWKQRKCLSVLIENGGNLHAQTVHGDRPRDVAMRYNHKDCAHFLDWSEAKGNLVQLIKETKEVVEDPQKLQGRLSKDEKMTALNACSEKQDWLDITEGPRTEDFKKHFKELSEILEPIQAKLAEPPPEKPSKR